MLRDVGICLAVFITLVTTQQRILPDKCDCLDWYGFCRGTGERWIDEDAWTYECKGTGSEPAEFVSCVTGSGPGRIEISRGENVTIEEFWYSCEEDEKKLKFSREPFCNVNGTQHHVGSEFRDGTFQWLCLETGRWVVGCYYKNETQHDVYLKIGQSGYNGLVKHTCDRWVDYPGRVQYYTKIRDDVHVKNPSNKGTNSNLPPPKDGRIKGKVDRWLHENADLFIANVEPISRIRYLAPSRRQWNTTRIIP